MAGGKSRTVYFLQPILRDGKGELRSLDPTFWTDLHERVRTKTTRERMMTYRERRYRGSAREEVAPAEKYLYVGKRRVASDWPDTALADADEEPLEIDGDLVEPMYVVPVRGRGNYAAFMRTSGGPTFAAFEEWVLHVLGLIDTEYTFELTPYVRRDELQRLRDADGVHKLRLKFEPDALAGLEGGGRIAAAAHQMQAIGGGGVDVEVAMSFGHFTPDGSGAGMYASELERALSVPGIKKAEATLVTRRPDGSFERDKVEFFRDRVTHKVPVGDSELARQTAPVVLRAMHEAIQQFRRELAQDD